MAEPPFDTCAQNNDNNKNGIKCLMSHANYTRCFIRFRNTLALFGRYNIIHIYYIVVADRLIRDFPKKITSHNTVFYTTRPTTTIFETKY